MEDNSISESAEELNECGFESVSVSNIYPQQQSLLLAGQMLTDDHIWWAQFGGGAAPESHVFVREDHRRVLILVDGAVPLYLAGDDAEKWVGDTLSRGEAE